MTMIKVSATSRTSAVAGAIAGVVREHHRAEIQAIGAGAVNQAVKALVVATGYLRLDGIHVSCVPEFAEVTIEDKVRTAIKLVVEPGATPNSSEAADVATEDKVMTAVEPKGSPNVSEDS
jgi:stage V sporulation protein S